MFTVDINDHLDELLNATGGDLRRPLKKINLIEALDGLTSRRKLLSLCEFSWADFLITFLPRLRYIIRRH